MPCLIFFYLNTLYPVVTDVTQHRLLRLLGEFKKENKPKSGKRNPPKLNCDPPPEGNAFLAKTDGQVLKAVSVKIKVVDCIREV